jgi:hypothetical protein
MIVLSKSFWVEGKRLRENDGGNESYQGTINIYENVIMKPSVWQIYANKNAQKIGYGLRQK